MKKYILARLLKENFKKIYEENENVIEIDFNKYIYKEKSDIYKLDEKNGYLEFITKEVEKINIHDFDNLYGRVEMTENSLELISMPYDFVSLDLKLFYAWIKKTINKKNIETILIEFTKSNIDVLGLRFCNKKFYNIVSTKFRSMVVNELFPNKEIFYDSGSKRVLFNFQQNNILEIFKSYNHNPVLDNTCSTSFNNCSLSFLVNLKNKYIILENRKIEISDVDYIEDEEFTLILECHRKNANSNVIGNTYIKSIVYGKENGFVYLKPIYMKKRKNKILCFYSGNPILQCYSETENRWINISNENELKLGKLLVRIKMSTEDKIYKLLIVN